LYTALNKEVTVKRIVIFSGLLGLAMLSMGAGAPAGAAVVIGGENGWQVSMDGMVSTFVVGSTVGNRNPSAFQRMQGFMAISGIPQSIRIRTGLLPSVFGFSAKSPPINGVTYGARLGLYPQVQNDGTRTGPVPGQ
jgi:hypothetical protein